MDHLRINDKSGSDVHIKFQDAIGGQETFGYAQTLVGRVVQCPFKPLGRCRDRRVEHTGNHEVGKRRDTFGTHRISLICHSGRSDLVLLKRFFNFF